MNLVPEALPSFSSQSGRDLRVVIAELRLAVAVLFTFQRRPIKDEGFISDTRSWLTRLVAILLRVATWRDHMFILNHVLRFVHLLSNWIHILETFLILSAHLTCVFLLQSLYHNLSWTVSLIRPDQYFKNVFS